MSDDTWGEGAHIADPMTGEVRVCADLCTTCIFRPGNLMDLGPGRAAGMVRDAVADEGHIVCHKTLGTDAPAICAGFARHPQGRTRSLALRMIRYGIARLKLIAPPTD